MGNNTALPLNKEEIKCKKLDDLEINQEIKFIKIDVQGFEKMVLEGATNLINKYKPIMVIEVENPCLAQFGYSSKELFETIRNLGYYIFLLDYEYPCDHICVPNEKLSQFEIKFETKIFPHTDYHPLTENTKYQVNRKIIM